MPSYSSPRPGRHIWAERYNRNLTDIFALQDDITTKILTAIRVKLTEGGQASSHEKYFIGKKGLDCYLKYLDGARTLQDFIPGSTMVARRIADEALEICPQNPMIYFLASWVTYVEFWMGMVRSPEDSIEKGIEWAQKGIAIDDSSSLGHSLLSLFYSLKKENEKAISEGERAVALEPGSANRYTVLGMSLRDASRAEEAISPLQKAIRLNPIGTSLNFLHLGHAYRDTGRLEESVSEYKKTLQRAPKNLFAYIGLVDSYIRMGKEEEARVAAAEVLRIDPKFSLDSYAKRIAHMKYADRSIESLRKAGLK